MHNALRCRTVDAVAYTRPLPATTDTPRRRFWRRVRQGLEKSPILSSPAGQRGRALHGIVEKLLPALGRVLRMAGLYERGKRNALDVLRLDLDLEVADLPDEFDGYRILHVSDPHFDMLPGLGAAIRRASEGRMVDLCVLTGDYKADEDGAHDQILPDLEALIGGIDARDGTLAVLGNHDGHELADALEDRGVRVLLNEAVSVTRGGARMDITGLDDVYRYYTPQASAALEAGRATGAAGHFALLLVHSPCLAERAAELGYAAYLCGHTHAGQICLPGGVPVATPFAGSRSRAHGKWRAGAMAGYTSPGAGVSGLPVRYFSRGAVSVLTLRKAVPAD